MTAKRKIRAAVPRFGCHQFPADLIQGCPHMLDLLPGNVMKLN